MMRDQPEMPLDTALPQTMLWLEQLVTGSAATIVATIAVGLLGFTMLTGRIDLKSAVRVLIGCFILFNAAIIAKGVSTAELKLKRSYSYSSNSSSTHDVITPPVLPSTDLSLDPYAGAAAPH